MKKVQKIENYVEPLDKTSPFETQSERVERKRDELLMRESNGISVQFQTLEIFKDQTDLAFEIIAGNNNVSKKKRRNLEKLVD